jgi:hypothetical protein
MEDSCVIVILNVARKQRISFWSFSIDSDNLIIFESLHAFSMSAFLQVDEQVKNLVIATGFD